MDRRRCLLLLTALALTLAAGGAALAAPSDEPILPPTPESYTDTPMWDQHSVWTYSFDGEYSALDSLNNGAPILNSMVSALFMLLALWVKLVIYVLHWAFSTEVVLLFVVNFVRPVIGVLRDQVFSPYAYLPVAAAGIAALYYWIRREQSRATGTLVSTFLLLLMITWGFLFLPTMLIAFNDGVTAASTAIMGGVASVDPYLDTPPGGNPGNAALRNIGNAVWLNLVVYPWCNAEFGSLYTCTKYTGDGIPGGQVLGQPDAPERKKFIERMPAKDKEMMQAPAAGIRLGMFLLTLPLALVLGGLFFALAGSLLLWQLWLAVLACLFPIAALVSLFPGQIYLAQRWLMNLLSALFMRLAVSLIIGLTAAGSSILWHITSNWMLAVLYNLVLTVMIIFHRGRIYGAVVGAFDGVQAAAGRTVDQKPTTGYLGGAVADATRRRVGGLVVAGATAALGAPLVARRALGSLQMRRLATESLTRRYTHEKEQARMRPGGKTSDFVRAADQRRSQGLQPFAPEQIHAEVARLEAMKKAGEDPRRALLKPGEDPTRPEFPLVQARFDQRVAAEKASMKRQVPRAQLNVDAAVRRRSGTGRAAGLVDRMRATFQRQAPRAPLWTVKSPGPPDDPTPPAGAFPRVVFPPTAPVTARTAASPVPAPPEPSPRSGRPPVWQLPAVPHAAATTAAGGEPAPPVPPQQSSGQLLSRMTRAFPAPGASANTRTDTAPAPAGSRPALNATPPPQTQNRPIGDLPAVGDRLMFRGQHVTVEGYEDLQSDRPSAVVRSEEGKRDRVSLTDLRNALKKIQPPSQPPPKGE